MARGLAHDIDDAAVALRFHGGQHGLYHREEAENLVAQLAFKNVERRALDGAAQMRAGIVDENVDAAELLERRIDEFLHRAFRR